MLDRAMTVPEIFYKKYGSDKFRLACFAKSVRLRNARLLATGARRDLARPKQFPMQRR